MEPWCFLKMKNSFGMFKPREREVHHFCVPDHPPCESQAGLHYSSPNNPWNGLKVCLLKKGSVKYTGANYWLYTNQELELNSRTRIQWSISAGIRIFAHRTQLSHTHLTTPNIPPMVTLEQQHRGAGHLGLHLQWENGRESHTLQEEMLLLRKHSFESETTTLCWI